MEASEAKSKAADISTAATTLLQKLSEAQEPLQKLGPPHLHESPPDLHNRLLVSRACMSRVSESVAQLVRLRGLSTILVITCEGDLQEAEAKAVESRPRISLSGEDFASAKERNARLATSTVQELWCLRQARIAQADADSALEYGRNRLWELDRAVRDIDTRLRILVYEPNVS